MSNGRFSFIRAQWQWYLDFRGGDHVEDRCEDPLRLRLCISTTDERIEAKPWLCE